MPTIYGMAIANALFLAFLLVAQTHTNRLANRWLALFLVMVAGLMADDFRDIARIRVSAFWAEVGVADGFLFAVGPSLYFSVLSFTQVRFRFRPRHGFHFVPWLVSLVLLCYRWFIDTTNPALVVSQPTVLSGLLASFSYIALVQTGLYVGLALRQLAVHRRNIQLFASATDRINLHWLYGFIAGVPVLLVVWGAVLFMGETQWVEAYPLILFGSFYYLGYFALNQSPIYPVSSQVAADIKTVLDEVETAKPSPSLLSPAEVDGWKVALLDLMETQKPYTDSDLTLPRLADLLDLRPHKLSFVINQGFAENFFQFINRYRVEESKRLLTNPQKQHFNILQIGYEAGFNSKTVFNTTFKRMTGLSPSDFQKTYAPTSNQP